MTSYQSYDVIVVGGGPSGFVAATAAARSGARTLLVERYGFLGGMPTSAALGPISPFHFGDEQVIKGIPTEFVDRMVESGGSTGHLKCTNPHGSGAYLCFYDREAYKSVAIEMVMEAGVEPLLHSVLLDTVTENGRVEGIRVVNKSGTTTYLASVVVDATGDADVAARAGASFTMGREEDGALQPVTLMFDMAEVDTGVLKRYMDTHPEDFEWTSELVALRPYSPRLQQEHFVGQGFLSAVRKGLESGRLYLGRDSILLLTTTHPGVVHFNSTRVGEVNGTDAASLTRGEIDARRQVMSLSRFLVDHIPGFENAYLSATGTQIGVRETRHIAGHYTLTGRDVIEGRKFDDVIARGYFPVDIHNLAGKEGYGRGGVWSDLADAYDIPYRCLVPVEIGGLVVAGRAISATHEAHGSFRTQGGVMAIGQAAGTAAALAANKAVEPVEVDILLLQEELESQGASLRRDPAVAEVEKARAEAALNEAIVTRGIRPHYLPDPANGPGPRL